MEGFMKGDVVVVLFPFSDLSSTKRRPALVVANLVGDDFILCQITSKARQDQYTISLEKSDFKDGSLPVQSCIRPNRLFTADKSIIDKKVGSLFPRKIKEVEKHIVQLVTG